MPMKLEDLVKPQNMNKLIEQEINKQREEEATALAKRVAVSIQRQVNHLRQLRESEKMARENLKRMNDAIAKYDKTGDNQVLRQAGLI